MTTEHKKKLLADVRNAAHALGQIVNGGHDLGVFGATTRSGEDRSYEALYGFGLLEAVLEEDCGSRFLTSRSSTRRSSLCSGSPRKGTLTATDSGRHC